LGAIVRRAIPNCYGETTSPLHGGFPTDRLVAEWPLRSNRVIAAISGASVQPGLRALKIALPANIRGLKANDPNQARKIQEDLRLQFADLFSRGYAVTGFERGDPECHYILEPYED
jgi:predicted GNAT superfamily acetyltransferase